MKFGLQIIQELTRRPAHSSISQQQIHSLSLDKVSVEQLPHLHQSLVPKRPSTPGIALLLLMFTTSSAMLAIAPGSI